MSMSGLPYRLRVALSIPVFGTLGVVALVLANGSGLHHLPATLAAGLATATLLTVLVARWADRALVRPLRGLLTSAEAITEGENPSYLPDSEVRELRFLSRSLELILTRHQAQRDGLAEQQEEFREILEQLTEGVLVADDERRVRRINRALNRLLGIPGVQQGEHLRIALRRPEVIELIDRTVETEIVQSGRLLIPDPDRELSLTATPLQHGGVLLVARDDTESKRLSTLRSELVANVSHELKTPLTAIRGYAETLHQGALDRPEVAQRFTGRILEQCARLQALLRDLLQLSRIESAGALPVQQPLDLAPLAMRAIEVLGPVAEEAEVRLDSEIESGTFLWANREAIEQVLLNLIENAIKYNRKNGSVVLRARQLDSSSVVEVVDTGIGIPSEDRDRIFERFYRVDKARSREAGGTGLGLAIVKHIVRKHNGRIDMESRLGKGTTFRVVLPRPTSPFGARITDGHDGGAPTAAS